MPAPRCYPSVKGKARAWGECMADVFISYRREDTRHLSARISDQLTSHFGPGRVFFDVDTLPRYAGMPFADVIKATVPQCPVFLAVIGPKWAEKMEAKKQDPEDWVQVEIRMALNEPGVRVVPVLVDGAAMPKADQLPPDLHPLLARQAITLPQDPHFREGVNELAKTLLAGRSQETNASTPPPASDVEANWAEIELSLDATRYRRFEKMFEAIPAAFRRVNEAEDRAKALERWALVDKTDPAAIAEFLRRPLFPALQNAAQSAMHQAAQAQAAREEAERLNQQRGEEAAAQAAREAAQAAREEAARLAQQQEAAAAEAAREEAARLAQLQRQEALGQSLRAWAIPAGTAGLALVLLLAWSPWNDRRSVEAPAGAEEAAAVEVSPAEAAAGASDPSPLDARSTPASTRAPVVTNPASLPDFALFRECEGCPEMVVIPAGSFLMGSPANEAGRDEDEDSQAGAGGSQLSVRIPRFAVGKFELTWAEWDRCVADGGCQDNSQKAWSGFSEADKAKYKGDAGYGRGARPVINIDWSDAKAYAKWLSAETGATYRLLSEAEWEYAARAGTTKAYPWGPAASHEYANYGTDSCCAGLASGADKWVNTAPVGAFPANPFGLFDMHGNVSEWVEDCYNDSLANKPANGTAYTTQGCSSRVDRGGSWYVNPAFLRSANRLWGTPSYRYIYLGFRVARTL